MTARQRVCPTCNQHIKTPDTLGGRILLKRLEKNKSQADLAGIIEKSTNHISAIERESTDIRFGDLKKIASYLQTDINFFIGES